MTGPFVKRFDPPLGGSQGPLAGKRLAVKDNFDIAGFVTGCGNPEWAGTHGPAEKTAPLVQTLQDQGAAIVGKTHMDELAYSLMGQNARFGTPENPAAPDRMPGGSSSGSATAVASGAADIGLGTDTGGSVRIPASFCGLFGWRPTHGLLCADGLVPLSQSYDVPGFMTRDGETMQLLADLLAPEAELRDPELLRPVKLWELADPDTVEALSGFPGREIGPLCSPEMYDSLLPTFRVCQGSEVAHNFADWISKTNPAFGPGIRERFAGAVALTAGEIADARKQRTRIAEYLVSVVTPRRLLVLPTAPAPAPLRTSTGDEMETYRNKALTLLCLAGHAGLPQVTIPTRDASGLPVGFSLIGPKRSDRALIRLACDIARSTSH
ncbi:amidase [Oricola sp.]|uniref:amidase n=1 Tax=Oricola sp. TaxID=1979950 RepID=UPI0025D6AB5B|nr:amidase [Oricola sp.]MCI5076107.1 amidase [Oricola sp.]